MINIPPPIFVKILHVFAWQIFLLQGRRVTWESQLTDTNTTSVISADAVCGNCEKQQYMDRFFEWFSGLKINNSNDLVRSKASTFLNWRVVILLSEIECNSKDFHLDVSCDYVTIAKLWKQPRCPTTDEWIKKMWYLYTIEFYAATKKNEMLSIRW
jgi:hypothetical protein